MCSIPLVPSVCIASCFYAAALAPFRRSRRFATGFLDAWLHVCCMTTVCYRVHLCGLVSYASFCEVTNCNHPCPWLPQELSKRSLVDMGLGLSSTIPKRLQLP